MITLFPSQGDFCVTAFFAFLDKIVHAFVPAGGATTMTKMETTTGGITTVKTSEVAAYIAGNAVAGARPVHSYEPSLR